MRVALSGRHVHRHLHVGLQQSQLHAKDEGAQGQRGSPVVAQDGEGDLARARADVGVPDPGAAGHAGGLERVGRGHLQVKVERDALKGAPRRAEHAHLPMEEARRPLVGGQGLDTAIGRQLALLEFLFDADQGPLELVLRGLLGMVHVLLLLLLLLRPDRQGRASRMVVFRMMHLV